MGPLLIGVTADKRVYCYSFARARWEEYAKPRRLRGRWTPEEVAHALECHAQGWSLERIADSLGGITRAAVRFKLNRLKEEENLPDQPSIVPAEVCP